MDIPLMPANATAARTMEELQDFLNTHGAERAFRLIATTNATGEFNSGIVFNLEGDGEVYGVRYSSTEIARSAVAELLSNMPSLHFEDVVLLFGLRAMTFHAAGECPDPVHCRR